jgi:type IV pilus assembly protein PilO
MKIGIREILFVLLMLGVLAGSYVFAFSRADLQRKALRADIRLKKKALADLMVATAGIDDVNRKTEDLQHAIEFFKSKLPQEREMDKILDEVSNIAAENSLKTKTIKPLKIERSPGYSEQPIQMSLSGDFGGYYQFLLQLERLPRVTRVMQMSLHKNQRDGEVTADMTLTIYFEPSVGESTPAMPFTGLSASAQ